MTPAEIEGIFFCCPVPGESDEDYYRRLYERRRTREEKRLANKNLPMRQRRAVKALKLYGEGLTLKAAGRILGREDGKGVLSGEATRHLVQKGEEHVRELLGEEKRDDLTPKIATRLIEKLREREKRG